MIYSRQALHAAHQSWLEQFNPMRGLTLARLGELFEAGNRGDYAELQWLNRAVERRDPTVQALKRRRRAAQRRLDWSIKTVAELPKGASEAQATAQKTHLHECYNRISNLSEALEFLMLADFRGFAHVEKHYNAQREVVHLQPVPQWHFSRDGLNGPWRFHAQPSPGHLHGGAPLPPKDFLVREVEDPAYEIFAIAFLRKNLAAKDWDGFLETYGIPWFFLVMPPGVAPDKEGEYYRVAQQLAGDGRGIAPHGTELLSPEPGLRGQNPFSEYLRRQDEDIVLTGTGGLLTMLSAPGSGTLAGNAHQEAWREIVAGEGQAVAELLQRQFDLPCLQAAFGPEVEPLVYFDYAEPEDKDVEAVTTTIVALANAGYRVDRETVEEETGLTLAEEAEPAAAPATPPAEGKEKPPAALLNTFMAPEIDAALQLTENTLAAALQAHREWLEPLRARLGPLLARGQNAALTEADLAALVSDLELALADLLPADLDAPSALIDALEAGLGSAAVLGLRESMRARAQAKRN